MSSEPIEEKYDPFKIPCSVEEAQQHEKAQKIGILKRSKHASK